MTNLPEGYWQAVENLALVTLKLTDESQTPSMSLLPDDTLFNASLDELMDYCEKFYTSSQIQQWEYLEKIMHVICDTYKTSAELTFGHVYAKMISYDVQSEQ